MSDKFQPLTLTPIKFSLTEGTSIPAPPTSPPASKPSTPIPQPVNGQIPSTPPADGSAENGAATQGSGVAAQPTSSQPQSPTHNRRMSGVRKLLSLRRGNSSRPDLLSSQNGKPSVESTITSRPGSPYAVVTPTSPHKLMRKQSNSWFNSGGKRKSSATMPGRLDTTTDMDPANVEQSPISPRGPPPPSIPEFREFISLNGELSSSLGGEELFKDIK